MAAANESQGLKIAVAAFVTLTVILAVTSYFLFSAYSKSEAQFEAAQEKLRTAQKAQNDAVNQYDDFRKIAGVRAEEADPAKAEVAAYFKKTDERIGNLATSVSAAIKQAQDAGATAAELEDAKAKVQTIVTSYRNEPNKNFISTQDRLVELLENLTLLSTQLSANYVGIRRGLESSNTNAKQQIDVQAKAASDNKADLEAEHNKHDSERQSLLTKVDQLQTDNDKKATELASLTTSLRQLKEESDRKLETANTIIREYRDQAEKQENVLDSPDGYVTYVDLDRREVHVSVNRHQGARPQMKMTIFAAGSPGIPTERPKGNIQLIQVGDRYSIARIEKTNSAIDPIRIGDIVYSAAWSPNEPMRFALIGKIDVNRDGKDDREDLKRMIQDAGGVIDYDLPPPEYGKESGKLSARIAWYVTDERSPMREVFQKKTDVTLAQQTEFQKKYGQAVKDARLEGIRPMPVGRLLAYLGYDMGTPIVGRAEAVNTPAMRQLIEPRKTGRQAAPAPESDTAKPQEDATKGATPAPEPEPKAEEPKAEEPK
jgi:hypothetical protein